MAVAINHTRHFMLAAALLLVVNGAQSQIGREKLDRRITVSKDQMRVDSLLDLFVKQSGIEFSFNSKKINPGKRIPVKKGVQTLANCLAQLQWNTGIHYAAIGNHIILLDNPPAATHVLNLQVKSAPVNLNTGVSKPSGRGQRTTTSGNNAMIKDTKKGDDLTNYTEPENNSRMRPFDPEQYVQNVIDEDLSVNAKPFASSTAILMQNGPAAGGAVPATGSARRNIIGKERDKNWKLGLGANLSKPNVYSGITGIGFDVQVEKPFGKRFSFTARTGYNLFIGEFQDGGLTRDSSIKKNFSNIPVLAGLRYYFPQGLYASFELGEAIGGGQNSSHLSFIPSAGYKFYIGSSTLDLGVKYTWIGPGLTTPEAIALKQGDYGIWSFHITYNF